MIVERLNRPDTAIAELPDVKSHMRVDGDELNTEVARMLAAAQLEAETYGSLALFDQDIVVTLSSWGRCDTFPLPVIPLVDWATVTVTAGGVPFDDFSVMTGQRPALRLVKPIPAGEVVIGYKAGFGALADDLPDDLREAIMDQAAAYFDARGPGDPKAVALSPHFARIVGRYRRVRL